MKGVVDNNQVKKSGRDHDRKLNNESHFALSVGGAETVGGGGISSQVDADRARNRVERAGRVGGMVATAAPPDEGPPDALGLPPVSPV